MHTQGITHDPLAPDFPRPMGVLMAERLTEPTLAEALLLTHPIPNGTRDRLGGLRYVYVAYGDLPSAWLRDIRAQETRAWTGAQRDSDPTNTRAIRYRQVLYRRMRACALVLAHREGR